ncbi:MAG: hypothetical protein U5R48_11615 [Gammaproteobacteria bacterium]|nr:hypothetical protein [Gammaproteobacteria bacterium]
MNANQIDTGLWEHELRPRPLPSPGRARRTFGGTGGPVPGRGRFVPLYSRAHGRPVGHRGELDVWRIAEQLGPDRARAEFEQRGCRDRVDALAPGLHMANYLQRQEDRGWLVIPVADAVPRHPGLSACRPRTCSPRISTRRTTSFSRFPPGPGRSSSCGTSSPITRHWVSPSACPASAPPGRTWVRSGASGRTWSASRRRAWRTAAPASASRADWCGVHGSCTRVDAWWRCVMSTTSRCSPGS